MRSSQPDARAHEGLIVTVQAAWGKCRNITRTLQGRDQKGVKLSKKAMEAVEARLERDAKLPKYDILIQPASTA